ncbi:hypothetical protein RvY_06259-2 [Ramazzottius varieornatus]|uniref:Cytochrome P450 n=2 Tax=Ramazzottius varieornatus TaxID=947166 RepID=A0A1D1UYG9_RAMVA|nr:hypothetical protein RvY_06259-2 [Ramazzottius varieornatus]
MYFAVANVISYMLFSDGFDCSDPRFRQYEETVAANIAELSSGTPLEIFPWLRFIHPFSVQFNRIQRRFKYCQRPMMDLIQEHKKSFDPNSPRDYVDAFLCVQEGRRRTEDSVGTYTDEQLMRNLGDLYVAGFETTTTFLRWALIYLILHPRVQAKLQGEIDVVIGSSRAPTMTDKAPMVYTEAVILEVFRLSDFLPFLIPHCATEDVQIDGYVIPEGTEIWPLVTYHYCNAKVWGDPQVFRPERFLDDKDQLLQSLADEIQPYSTGRRACLGEPLAKMEVFILLTTILQHFTISSQTTPDTEHLPAFSTFLDRLGSTEGLLEIFVGSLCKVYLRSSGTTLI